MSWRLQKGAAESDVVVLAVKPFIMGEALKEIAPQLKTEALIVSIAAGISSAFIEQTLGDTRRVIRVMPNTPMLAGKGMSALAAGAHATQQDMITVERIFAAAGKTVRVEESAMDAVTAVSGSGPAYVFFLAETLAQAGAAAGLSEAQAAQLARDGDRSGGVVGAVEGFSRRVAAEGDNAERHDTGSH